MIQMVPEPCGLRLPGSGTVLAQLYHLPETFSINERPFNDHWKSQGIPDEQFLNLVPETLQDLRRKYLWLPLQLFSTSYLSFPSSPPHTHKCTRPLSSTSRSCNFCSLFLFHFPGSNQEKIWEHRLPIRAREWHAAVWVSTSLLSHSFKQEHSSVSDNSQAVLVLQRLFVRHRKWTSVSIQYKRDCE